jgi:hypothetical protein
MPYVCVFSEGEVMRNAVSARFRHRWLIGIGFLLLTLTISPFFTLVYCVLLLAQLKRTAVRPTE